MSWVEGDRLLGKRHIYHFSSPSGLNSVSIDTTRSSLPLPLRGGMPFGEPACFTKSGKQGGYRFRFIARPIPSTYRPRQGPTSLVDRPRDVLKQFS